MIFEDMPIVKSLIEYRNSNVIPFHVPGHKMGNGFIKAGIDFESSLMALDTTEVPGIDNLHNPEASIKKAQELAASAFGADQTFFLVNGTTCGIYSMIMAATEPGDSIIVARNCHKSVIAAIILGRLKPIYIMPETDEDMGISCGILPENIERALKHNPDVKAVVITNPTYYGICSDIKAISEVVHKYEKVLLVDEAHGAHFNFNSRLPVTAMSAGADIAVQSTHKTLTSMTGSSMLHVKGERINIERLKFFLQIHQTTSPSHLMLASLDMARYIAEIKGNELLDDVIDYSEKIRKEINKIEGFYCLDENKKDKYGIYDIDPTKIVINFRRLGLSGVDGDNILRKDYNIQFELSDPYNAVAVGSIGDTPRFYDDLLAAIKNISEKFGGNADVPLLEFSVNKALPELCVLPHEAIYRETGFCKLDKSIGKVCAELVLPYPPGIPLIMPGEIITEEVVNYINTCIKKGIKLNGALRIYEREIKILI